MCYVSTPYYLLCGCYGKRAPIGEGCIRATGQPGWTNGCADQVDMGIESVNEMCPRCTRGAQSALANSSDSREKSNPSPHEAAVDEKADGGSDAQPSRLLRLSTAECAKGLLKSLPPSVKKQEHEQKEKYSRANTNSPAEFGKAQVTRNLHWRAYDSARYSP